MDDERFDAIVIGAGMAGGAAAYRMAEAGLSVLLVERGEYAGAKNMTGGRIYTHTLEKLYPNFREEAPLERKIKNERISILNGKEHTVIEYGLDPESEEGESYTVLRGHFDQWLAEKAEDAGAMYISNIQASELLMEDGKVVGVKCGEDDLFANVVVIADGVNSMLAEKAGLRKPVTPDMVAVGAKDVWELDEKVLQDRFNLNDGEGTACLMLGDISHGIMGGGFLYTNKNTISLGIVAGLKDIGKADANIEDMVDQLEAHPSIAPLIKDATLVERSGHVVPEAGFKGVSTLSGDGFVIVGDAAGLCMNLGFTVRGMDLAIQSGICAADTIIACKVKESYTAQDLSAYGVKFLSSPVGKDMQLYSKLPEFMENERLFTEYPELICGVMHDLFTVAGTTPAEPLMKKLMKRVKKVGMVNLAMDGMKGVRSL